MSLTTVVSTSSQNDTRYIKPGDLVIVFVSRDKAPMPLTIAPGEQLSNFFGHFSHNDMVGLPYGSKMTSRKGRGYIYLLRPTAELWTLALPHRTQILYAPDMSFITMKLNLGPGSKAIEAGTGSGSFSHTLARTVARGSAEDGNGQAYRNWKGLPNQLQNSTRTRSPKEADQDEQNENSATSSPESVQMIDAHVDETQGRLWSFEFHAARAEKARSEFAAHELDKVVVLNHRNVCRDGFGLTDAADAIFLDLPAPWEAIPHAVTALRRNILGRICCFSPCIEQVLKTVQALTQYGFTDIDTFESLVRTHESMSAAGPQVSVDEAITRIREVERRKESRRIVQIERSRQDRLKKQEDIPSESSVTATLDNKDEGGSNATNQPQLMDVDQNDDPNEKKRKREHDSADGDEATNAQDNTDTTVGQGSIAITKKKARQLAQQLHQKLPFQPATVYSRPYYEMRGHTSYLTFATLLPRDMPKSQKETIS